jgi:quinol monooxygenase YgiN
MVKLGFLATLVAKPGKADELSAFLQSALPLANAEDGTIAWFAIQIDPDTYGIFDVFETEESRQAHINGPIAAALMANADELLAEPPSIKPIDVLAVKLPD